MQTAAGEERVTSPRAGLRVAIDARAAAEVEAGRGRYVRELLRHLAALDAPHTYVLYARAPWDDDALDDARFRWRIVSAGEPHWSGLAALRVSRECDVVLATNSYLLAALARIPALAVVHDLASFRDDVVLPRGAAFERLTLPLAVRRATTLVANSEATRADLVARFPRAAAKSAVTRLAADAAFAREEQPPVARGYGLDKPYVLALGTLEPRKNLPRLIEAFAGLPAELRDAHELVLVGGSGWATGETEASIARCREHVRPLGYVPDADLPGLYREAALFAYPSLFEGFGLPVLEAMAAGTAVVTSNVSSLPEVGGDAVRYADPIDVASIRAALASLLRDPGERARLAAAGRERAQSFSWDRTARETLALVEAATKRAT